MRIKLTAEAEQAMADVSAQVAALNPFLEMDKSAVVSHLIVVAHRAIGARDLEEMTQALSTPESRRLSLVRQVERLSESLDPETLRTLEASIKKLGSQSKKTGEAKNEPTQSS